MDVPSPTSTFGETSAVGWMRGGRPAGAGTSGGRGPGRSTWAGAPATTVHGGTSRVTTEPAPTMAPSPMVTLGMTMTPAPSQASCSMTMRPRSGSTTCASRDQLGSEEVTSVTRGAMATRSPMTSFSEKSSRISQTMRSSPM